jgi:hypothetical protein
MFRLLTTEGFAGWFSGLRGSAAEDVAATLDVIERLGANTEAPGSSEWLLWYEHPSMGERMRRVSDDGRKLMEMGMRAAEQWGSFLGYTRRALKHLESPQFTARLGRLTPDDAGAVAFAVSRIRAALKSRQMAMSGLAARRPLPDTPEFQRLLDLTDVRHWYFAALSAAGFAVEDVPAHSHALREIALRQRTPELRILYGIDARRERERGLVVLGEWLDRSFYGDSVRRAESLWRQFLDDGSLTAPEQHRR